MIQLFKPSITDQEIEAVAAVLRSGWLGLGPKTAEFERAFAEAMGVRHAVALNSGTAALHLALKVLNVGPGDEVLVPAITFASTAEVVLYVGARPVFVDVEPDTLNVSVEDLERKVTPRARGIIVVHYGGHPCEMDALLSIAAAYGLAVVEDAAHALPATYRGQGIGAAPALPSAVRRPPSAFPRLTCFSFYATKNLTTAEGGMLTGAPELIEQARVWSLHGMSRDAWKRYSAEGSWYYEVVRPGFKYNMTDIQAALGIQQLRRLPAFRARRREIARRYTAAFSAMPELRCPVERPGVEHAWHIYALRLNLERLTIDRARFIEELQARRIGTSVHFIPIHLHPYYRDKYGYRPDDFPVACREYWRLVSLPIYPRMTDDDVQDVIDAVADVVEKHRR